MAYSFFSPHTVQDLFQTHASHRIVDRGSSREELFNVMVTNNTQIVLLYYYSKF